MVDVAESGETTDERDGAAEIGLAVGGEDVAEDNLPDVEADNVDDRAGAPTGLPGSIDVLRVGAGTEEGVVDDLGGIVAFEAGAKVDEGDFLAAELDVTADFGVEEAWAVVVDFPVTAGVSAVLEVGGGTTLVTPVPNLPEFNIFLTWGVGGPEAVVLAVAVWSVGTVRLAGLSLDWPTG